MPTPAAPAPSAAPAAPPAPAPAAPTTLLTTPPPEKAPETPAAVPPVTGEAAPAGEGEKAPEAPAADAGESITVKWAESLKVAPEAAKGFVDLATAQKLNAAQAQAVADFYGTQAAGIEKANAAAFEATQARWMAELKADKDFGGEKLAATAQVGFRAVKQFGDAAFTELLERSGLGNHPAAVRFMARVGRAMADDSLSGGSDAPGKPNAEQAALRARYPTMFKDKE